VIKIRSQVIACRRQVSNNSMVDINIISQNKKTTLIQKISMNTEK